MKIGTILTVFNVNVHRCYCLLEQNGHFHLDSISTGTEKCILLKKYTSETVLDGRSYSLVSVFFVLEKNKIALRAGWHRDILDNLNCEILYEPK